MDLPPVEIKKILYATDLSENARRAFAYAASLANLYGAEILLLHVLAEDTKMEAGIVGYIGEERWNRIKEQNRQEAREALISKKRDNVALRMGLEQFVENAQPTPKGEGRLPADEILLTRGKPEEQILRISEERNCDLIVMGTHGHGVIADAMMGSAARRVIRRSRIPVLVVRLPDEE